MINSRPLISIVFPSYNHEQFVEEAVRSTWAQSYPNVEIIVVDDASTDNTPVILENLNKKSPVPMRVVHNASNVGPVKSINRAISLSKGEFLALFASDDKYSRNRFTSQIRLFQEDSHMMIVYGNGRAFEGDKTVYRLFDEKTKRLFSEDAGSVLKYMYTSLKPLPIHACLIRKHFLLQCGGFDETVLSDDYVLSIRMFESLSKSGGHFAFVDEDLYLYRLHGTNLHKDHSLYVKRVTEIMTKYIPPVYKKKAYATFLSQIALKDLEEQRFNHALINLLKSLSRSFSVRRLTHFVKVLLFQLTKRVSLPGRVF